MGREIRRVPPHWEHPKNENGRYQPLYDHDYLTELNEWWEEHQLWVKGEHRCQNDSEPSTEKYYAQYNGSPPDVKYYRDYDEESATWYALYETVSEGTPVTPSFETQQELIDYLVENGDFWYQSDQAKGQSTFRTKPTRAQAENLVYGGFAMSFMVQRSETGVKVMDAYEQQDIFMEGANGKD